MKKTFFTPGPSELYYTYPDHHRTAMRENIGAISHRSKAFEKLYRHTIEQLTELLQLPEDYRVLFVSSATECWERIAQNLITQDSEHFVHGDFGRKFFETSQALGKQARLTPITGPFEATTSSANVIALTMNETSTGFQHTAEDLKEMRRLNPSALIALDVVTATPSLEIDFSLVDTAYFSVQKCFGLPAGLGVWLVNERAMERAIQVNHPSFHSLPSLLKMAEKNQTPETPNVLGIYLLGKIAEDMLRRGISAIRSETNYKAALLYQTMEALPLLSPAIMEKPHRSKTTLIANTLTDSSVLISRLEEKGMILGSGYGARKTDQVRIANFPAHSKEQVEMLCDTLQNLG